MPFTFSHPAIILPLKRLPKKWISMTALVVGSIIPDFEYFIRMGVKSLYSHTWAGLFWFDLPLGLIVLLIYNRIVKDSLIDHLPAILNRRFSMFKGSNGTTGTASYLIITCACILTGAASHIFWDSFTHPSGYFVHTMPFLTRVTHLDNNKIYYYNIAQHLSTMVGAIAVLASIITLKVGKRTVAKNIKNYWIKVSLVSLITLIIRFSNGINFHEFGNFVMTSITGLMLGLLTASLLNNSQSRA